MSMTQIEQLIAVLSQNQVSFVLIGGLAANAHGSAQLTFDVDVCYERTPDNIQRLCIALEPFHPYLRGAPPGLPFRFDPPTVSAGLNFTLTTDLGDLDLLGEVSGLGSFDQVVTASERIRLFGFAVWVLSLEGLIRSKKAAGRPKDLNALPELEALLALRNQKS
ncbi:MAG: hypothetical protein AB1817_17720 [Chloroflexota bacterium]